MAARPFLRDKAPDARQQALMFRFEQVDQFGRIVLDRPEARNAIPLEGWGRLAQLVAEISTLGVRLLVVSGSRRAFCAGADLGDFGRLREDETARIHFRQSMREALDALTALEVPVVAWIEGPCYGAGVALAMACDLRIASASASFAITPAKIGISYPQEDVHRLVELVGPGQAARLLFTALSIDSGEARNIGLVDLLTDDPIETIEAIVSNDGESVKLLKLAIRRALEGHRQDRDLDARFDSMIAGDKLVRRLEALRRK
jgi:enoyl-CoA hydratase/carnithine racemase